MPGNIILLSGPISSGKSTLGLILQNRCNARLFKTNELIREHYPKLPDEREAFQKAGERLDRRTKGAWVKESLARKDFSVVDTVIVDCVRIKNQINQIRSAFGARVFHIHLTASDEELERRYSQRKSKIAELPTYEQVRKSRTERNVSRLAQYADIVVLTDRCTKEDVFIRAAARLGLYPRDTHELVDVLVGGQYGSEGKGNIAAYIAPEYDILLRVGGPNAGHTVFGEPNQVYHHLPSGTIRAQNAKLVIGPGAVIDPDTLLREISTYQVRHDRLAIDPQAMVIRPLDIKYEKDNLTKISSTAQGVGAATARKINHRGKFDSKKNSKVTLAKDVSELKPFIGETYSIIENAFLDQKKIFLEGTQGTSLSLHHGIYPYVTSRDTTVSGCLAEAGISPKRVRRIIMVCRTYPIRVGGPSGPMSQGREITSKEIAKRSGLTIDEIDSIEVTTTTGKPRRFAEFDWTQLRKSAILNGATDIALTFADYLDVRNREARRFEQLRKETINFVEEVERVSGVPVNLISTRFHFRNIIDRRPW